jgi:hypothetical protein
MEYCSLQDAFPDFPAAGGKGSKATKIARREERKKAERCKGPPMTFLNASTGDEPVVDPDRPALRPLPETPPMNMKTGLIEHSPVDAPPAEPFTDAPPIARFRSEVVPSATQALHNTFPKGLPKSSEKPKYFGANFDEDVSEGFASFTNVIGDDPSYRMPTDFTKSFEAQGYDKAAGEEILPVPSMNNFWKPLTPSGARSSFFTALPAPGGTIPSVKEQANSPFDKEEFFKKLDTIYARLDDLETRRGENTQTEVLMFIMSGIFVLFTMDLLVRKTGNVRILNNK